MEGNRRAEAFPHSCRERPPWRLRLPRRMPLALGQDGQPNQLRQRTGAHGLHQFGSAVLDRRMLMANSAAISRFDLPASSRSKTALTLGEPSQSPAEVHQPGDVSPILRVPSQRRAQGLFETLIAAFHFQKIEDAELHGRHGGGDIGIRGDDDNRQSPRPMQQLLQPRPIALGAAWKLSQRKPDRLVSAQREIRRPSGILSAEIPASGPWPPDRVAPPIQRPR